MKKKIMTVISLIVAFVMCFALVACNDPSSDPVDPEGPADKNQLPADKMIAAVENLATLHGYTVGGKMTLDSDGTDTPDVTEFTLEKKGDFVKVSAEGEDTVYINFKTGYLYTEVEGGSNCAQSQAIPSGYAAYIVEVIKNAMPTDADKAEFRETLENLFSYDDETKTGSYTLKLKDVANELVAPVQKSYKNGGMLGALIDEYLEMFVPDEDYQSVAGILNQLVKMYGDVEDVTLGEAMTEIEKYLNGQTVPELLESVGFGLPDDQWTAIRERTVGEAVAGLIKFVNSMMPGNNGVSTLEESGASGSEADDDDEPSEAMQMVYEALNYILFEEITDKELEQVPATLEVYKAVIVGMLNSINVKTTIDKYSDKIPADVLLLITKPIKMTALDAKVEFTFDDDYNFSNLTITGLMTHDYTSVAGDGAKFFADNNYTCTIELGISDYVTEGEYNITVAPRTENPGTVSRSVIVVADPSAEKVDFYYEEAGTITVSDYKFLKANGSEYTVAADAVTYNAASKTFSVKYSALAPMIAAEDFYTVESGVITMTADVEYSAGETYTLEVKITVAKDASAESLMDVSTPIVMSAISYIRAILPPIAA